MLVISDIKTTAIEVKMNKTNFELLVNLAEKETGSEFNNIHDMNDATELLVNQILIV